MLFSRSKLSATLAVLLSTTLVITPVFGASSAGMGVVVYAQSAHVGTATASVGTTVFIGDKLDTEKLGGLQIRAGASRLSLSSASRVTWGADNGVPTATLTGGTATFSTAASNALALHVATAVVRPQSDLPTIGKVTVLSPKELLVQCTRGALTFGVEDDVRVVSEGEAYHVVLDPNAVPPPSANDNWAPKYPKKPGHSKFMWFAIALISAATIIPLIYAFESNDGSSANGSGGTR